MTSSSDIILKSWLRTLRYSIECYEDFDSANNRRRESNLGNMIIGADTGDDSDDGHYVNIWDCSRSEKSALNSLESLEYVSEVSTFGSENAVLSSGSYCLGDVEGSLEKSLKVTDLDDECIGVDDKRTRKKPVPTPRLRNSSENNEVIYVNLPLRDSQSNENVENYEGDSVENTELSLEAQKLTFTSPIYENLPLISQNSSGSNDSLKFDEEVSSTMQYFEKIIDSAGAYSDDSESDESELADADFLTIDSKYEEDICSPQCINDQKLTDSSSSFEEYFSEDQLRRSAYKAIEVERESLCQRFAKNNRASTFFEEQEPGLPQEVKHIPIPKSKSTSYDVRKRFSVPIRFREEKEDICRPQSLGSKVKYQAEDIIPKTEASSKGNNTLEEELPLNNYIEETSNLEEETVVRQKPKSAENLNLSFAKELRISSVFEECVVEEIQTPKPVSEKLVVDQGWRKDVVFWMALLVEESSGESAEIMEEKELLKSINQVPKDRAERPTENKFPLDDVVEVRKKPDIKINRLSKTTDFDLGRRKQTNPINPKNFEIRGIVKIELLSRAILTKWKEEYIAYENENFYRINEKTKNKELLATNVLIKSIRYPKSKESKEVELRDSNNLTYVLHFQELKHAKQFMENEKLQVYITDNKVTIKKTLLRFLGKRSSREILEKKGIYRNEPIFGNTLKDIYIKGGTGSLVPAFIYEVISLLERPENIKSLGVYRTSGNLATIQKIRFEVDNGRLNILCQYAKDPDVLTGSLKLFFRELKEPLISREVCEKLLEFAKMDLKQISSKEHQRIRTVLVKNLHESNLETFAVVMRHLLEVIKYKEHNKMDSYNLAVCWGPSIIFSVYGANVPTSELSKDIVTQSHDATRLVDFFLVYYDLYPAELGTLGRRQRPESLSEKMQSLKRQESRDSVESLDSFRGQKKSVSSISLSVDEITKKLVEFIDPHVSCEGLYRKSGSSDKTTKIIKKLNKKKINELEKYKNDVHDLTDALKKYLKEQDCLVNEDTTKLVLETSPDSSQNCLEPATRRKVVSLIEDTPKKDTLIYLLRHLAKVLECQERTFNVPKNDLINVWTNVLNNQKKSKTSNDDFAQFLAIAVKVFNDNLPDVVRSSLNNNGGSPNRNKSMDELLKEMKHQQAEKDRNSRYDNVDSDVGEASILEDKTEQTKL